MIILHSEELLAAIAGQSVMRRIARRVRNLRKQVCLPRRSGNPSANVLPTPRHDGAVALSRACWQTQVRLTQRQIDNPSRVEMECHLEILGDKAEASYFLRGRKYPADVVEITPEKPVRTVDDFIRFRINARRRAREILYEKEIKRRAIVRAYSNAASPEEAEVIREKYKELTGYNLRRRSFRTQPATLPEVLRDEVKLAF